jgi:hypothetical protein
MTTLVDELREVLDKFAALDPGALASMEDTKELSKQLDRLEAITTRAFGRFDASHDWMPSRCRSAADWLAWQRHMPRPTAKRRQRLARALRAMPAAEAAWVDGEITSHHVGELAKACDRVPENYERDEKVLVDDAKQLRYSSFYRCVEYWLAHADPDGVEDAADRVRDRRRFDMSRSFQDAYFADGYFDPIAGTIIFDELNRLENQLFEADWVEARERLGTEPCFLDLRRTSAQRRADALVEMAVRSRTAPAGGRRPEPLFTVLVDYESFAGRICELANRAVVTPGSLVPWIDQAWIERVVFDGPSRVIDVGTQRRLFEGATRRAVEVRDQECFHPSCEEAAQDCQIDHIEPYSWGGPTTQANGRPACGPHNRATDDRSHRPVMAGGALGVDVWSAVWPSGPCLGAPQRVCNAQDPAARITTGR